MKCNPFRMGRPLKRPEDLISDDELHEFTSKLLKTFPLEIQRATYSHLFDPSVMDTMSLSAQPSPDNYPICYTTYMPDNIKWPRFVKSGVINEEVAIEIVQAFFEAYKYFEVVKPAEISWFLKQDFFTRFGFGVSPSSSILSALTVDICLNRHHEDFFSLSKLDEHFQPLLNEDQKWSQDFQLTVRLWTGLRPWRVYRDEKDKFVDAAANIIHATLQKLRPILQAAQHRRGKVVVVLEVGRTHKLKISAAQMDYPKEAWVSRLNTLVRNPDVNQ